MQADAARASPAADRRDGALWAAFGAAVLVASIRMDRLEEQDINPYTIPGLLPGLLGIALLVMGGLMILRGWRAAPVAAPAAGPRHGARIALVIALCVGFGTALVGHGLPFWLAACIFVAAAILVLGPAPGARDAVRAVVIGLGAGLAVTLVFQDVFLVRLP